MREKPQYEKPTVREVKPGDTLFERRFGRQEDSDKDQYAVRCTLEKLD